MRGHVKDIDNTINSFLSQLAGMAALDKSLPLQEEDVSVEESSSSPLPPPPSSTDVVAAVHVVHHRAAGNSEAMVHASTDDPHGYHEEDIPRDNMIKDSTPMKMKGAAEGGNGSNATNAKPDEKT